MLPTLAKSLWDRTLSEVWEPDASSTLPRLKASYLRFVAWFLMVITLGYQGLNLSAYLLGFLSQYLWFSPLFGTLNLLASSWVLWLLRRQIAIRAWQVRLLQASILINSAIIDYTVHLEGAFGTGFLMGVFLVVLAWPLPFWGHLPLLASAYWGVLWVNMPVIPHNMWIQLSYVLAGLIFSLGALAFGHHLNHLLGSLAREIEKNRRENEFKSQILGLLSHDLRNSLGSSYLLLDFLQRRWEVLDDQVRRQDVQQIRLGLERTYELLEGLVLWAKSRLGHPSLEIRPFLPADIIDRAWKLWELETKAKGLILVARGLDRPLEWDPVLYEIVMRNVIHNAIKVSPPGGQIEVGLEKDNGCWRGWVQDQGPGFEPTAQEKQETTLGHGLGLRLIQELIQNTGAQLRIESFPGRGAKVILSYEPPHSKTA